MVILSSHHRYSLLLINLILKWTCSLIIYCLLSPPVIETLIFFYILMYFSDTKTFLFETCKTNFFSLWIWSTRKVEHLNTCQVYLTGPQQALKNKEDALSYCIISEILKQSKPYCLCKIKVQDMLHGLCNTWKPVNSHLSLHIQACLFVVFPLTQLYSKQKPRMLHSIW